MGWHVAVLVRQKAQSQMMEAMDTLAIRRNEATQVTRIINQEKIKQTRISL